MSTFIALLAAFSVGTIISAVIAHLTVISSFRQAWINALRDDLARFFKSLERMNYAIQDYNNDSEKYEAPRRDARIAVLFVYERIRLRLNRTEEMHKQLEGKLREFIDTPLPQTLTRAKIDEAVDLARQVLKVEWQVTKCPRLWKQLLECLRRGEKSNGEIQTRTET